jgi:serine protease Do
MNKMNLAGIGVGPHEGVRGRVFLAGMARREPRPTWGRLWGFFGRIVLGGALLISSFAQAAPSGSSKTNAAPRLNIEDAPLHRDLKSRTSFAPIIKTVAPSVVNIYSTTKVPAMRSGRNPTIDDLFRNFFGGEGNPPLQPRDQKSQSLGSGVIVSSDGYVLTANHVVKGADRVQVALANGEREFDARVIGNDPSTDVAVLKIEAKKPFPAITIGDSDQLEVGDMVLAIGNPFGVGQTVTSGIVSGLGRGVGMMGPMGLENFIQTDAAINPGNSGGALVDAAGRLVGINSLIYSESGGFQGVGFAVPSTLARFVMNQLITEGKVTRGYLGINIQPLTQDLAKEFNLPDESSGVLVGGVSPGSAAEKAGIKEGDIILEFNGKKMTDPRALQVAVSLTRPGTKAPVKILTTRTNRSRPSEKVVTVSVGDMPGNLMGGVGSSGREESTSSNSKTDALDGVEVTDLDSRTRRQMDVPNSVKGAIVVSVDPNSNSAEAGLRPGDVIVEINREAVDNADSAVRLSEKVKTDKILLRVWSKSGPVGGTRFIVVNNSARK